jgi:WhiB family redox-sensing transcriptional regulator
MTAPAATGSPEGQHWSHLAACADDPDAMHPERGDDLGLRRARAVCRPCPVREQCLADALAVPDGSVRAGLSERQRRRLLRA